MFTGLVEATGTITQMEQLGEQMRITLSIPFASELILGESVATNGCCLTVSQLGEETADFDVLTQTLKVTSLGQQEIGSLVNLERAMRASDRLGGHFVQGHVDDTGTVLDYSQSGQDHRLEISLPKTIHSLCIDKGSIAIDGISLTIAELTETSAIFWITPHTHANTHLQNIKIGHQVNLEADVLAKYVAKLVKKN